MVSGLAPGRPAETLMVGKSTCGSGETGSRRNAAAPARKMAMLNNAVATGRRMNGAEMLAEIFTRQSNEFFELHSLHRNSVRRGWMLLRISDVKALAQAN